MTFFIKHKNFIPILIAVLLIIIACCINTHAAGIATILLLLGILVFVFRNKIGIFLSNHLFHSEENEIAQNSTVSSRIVTTPKAVPSSRKTAVGMVPGVIEDWLLRYLYQYDVCLIDHAASEFMNYLGRELSFVQEPENVHDSNAVAIYCDSVKIGYVYRANHQDMFNSWIEHQERIYAYVYSIDPESNKIVYNVGFYKPIARFTKRTYKLTHVKDERRDNLQDCISNQPLDIEDGLDGGYIIENGYGEIGELPKSSSTFLDDARWAIAVFSDFVHDDDYEPKTGTVDIYIQKNLL